jgi:hypothetical protein
VYQVSGLFICSRRLFAGIRRDKCLIQKLFVEFYRAESLGAAAALKIWNPSKQASKQDRLVPKVFFFLRARKKIFVQSSK